MESEQNEACAGSKAKHILSSSIGRVITPFKFAIFLFAFSFLALGPEGLRRYLKHFTSLMSPESKTASCAGWHQRALATPHPSPSTYTPTSSSLDFTVLRSTPVQPEGFTLAVFRPGLSEADNDAVVIDALGRVLILNPNDYQGLLNLAQSIANDLPTTGKYRNTWMIKQPIMCRPIERVLVRSGDEKAGKEDEVRLKETRVQGYEAGKRELKEFVGHLTELPAALYDFVGLSLEAREGYKRGKEYDIVQKVKDIVDAGKAV